MSSALPKIDDQYWFDASKNWVDGAIKQREQAAEKLQTLITWLWAIYTAFAAVGFSLSTKALDHWVAITVASASGALILVYWAAVWVQMPPLMSFDPRSPSEIRRAYVQAVRIKNKRLGLTVVGSVIAAFLVSLAIFLASTARLPVTVVAAAPDMRCLITYDGPDTVVSVTAQIGKASRAELTVGRSVGEGPVNITPVRTVVLPSDSGLVQTSIRLLGKAKSAQVQLVFTGTSQTQVQLSKEIKVQTAGEST